MLQHTNGTLYIVPTPIGNLQDITLRAITTLRSVSVIACEDTRRTGILLHSINEHFPLDKVEKPRLISYFEQNEKTRIPELISLLKEGVNIALVSDAGTPAISDPGFRLVQACILENIPLVSLPGPSSILPAVTLSGLPTDKFLFLGYMPHKKGNTKKLLENVKKLLSVMKTTIVFFETPHRLLTTLELLAELFPERKLVVCRELTKIHEEIVRDTPSNVLLHFQKRSAKGEFVLLL